MTSDALIDEWREHRAQHAPAECNHGDPCWVREPYRAMPAGNASVRCIGCRGRIKDRFPLTKGVREHGQTAAG